MISFSYFLLESQHTPTRIEFDEIQYHFNESLQWFHMLQTAISRYYDALVVFFSSLLHTSLLLDLNRRPAFNDDIKLLASRTLEYDVISAVFLSWTGILQVLMKRRRAVFSLILASLRFKKMEFDSFAIWNCILGWATMKGAKWDHIQSYCKSELLSLIGSRDPFDVSSFRIVQSIAYSEDKLGKEFHKESVNRGFFKTLAEIPSSFFPLDTQLSVPYIRSVCVRYQENYGETDTSEWPHLSDNREEDDRFAPIMNLIGRSHVDGNRIPQFHEGDGYSARGQKRQSTVSLGQQVVVEIEVQNSLDEILPCEKIECVVQGEAETPSLRCILDPLERKVLDLFVIPRKEGTLKITGIRFRLRESAHESYVTVTQPISLPGIRLNRTLEQRQRNIHGNDTALDLHVIPSNCALSARLDGIREYHFFSELSKIPMILENCGNETISEVLLLTTNYHWFPPQQNRSICESLFPTGNGSDADRIQCYSLLKEGEFLEKGVSLNIGSYIHYPETDGNEFIREGKYELTGVFLFSTVEGNWGMIRFHKNIPIKRLIECKEQPILLSGEASFYKTVVENVSDEQKIEGVSVGLKVGSYF